MRRDKMFLCINIRSSYVFSVYFSLHGVSIYLIFGYKILSPSTKAAKNKKEKLPILYPTPFIIIFWGIISWYCVCCVRV